MFLSVVGVNSVVNVAESAGAVLTLRTTTTGAANIVQPCFAV
jgi:hypothetical protein